MTAGRVPSDGEIATVLRDAFPRESGWTPDLGFVGARPSRRGRSKHLTVMGAVAATAALALGITAGTHLSRDDAGGHAAASPTEQPELVSLPQLTVEADSYAAMGVADVNTSTEGLSIDELTANDTVIGAVRDELNLAAYPGFAGQWPDQASLTLHVWYVGGVLPAAVAGSPSASGEVELVVHNAAYDLATMDSEIARLDPSSFPGLIDLQPRLDGAGLVATVESTLDPDGLAQLDAATDLPIVAKAGGSDSRVGVFPRR